MLSGEDRREVYVVGKVNVPYNSHVSSQGKTPGIWESLLRCCGKRGMGGVGRRVKPLFTRGGVVFEKRRTIGYPNIPIVGSMGRKGGMIGVFARPGGSFARRSIITP